MIFIVCTAMAKSAWTCGVLMEMGPCQNFGCHSPGSDVNIQPSELMVINCQDISN